MKVVLLVIGLFMASCGNCLTNWDEPDRTLKVRISYSNGNVDTLSVNGNGIGLANSGNLSYSKKGVIPWQRIALNVDSYKIIQ